MNAHASFFLQIPAMIVKTLPDPIDQMKFFELIQIVPAPTRSALRSGNLLNYRVSDPTIMKYLRNNSAVRLWQGRPGQNIGHLPRNSRRMWLSTTSSNARFRRFNEIKTRQKG
jgi:hypothetical protein